MAEGSTSEAEAAPQMSEETFRVRVRAEKAGGLSEGSVLPFTSLESFVDIDYKYLPFAGEYFEARLCRWKKEDVVISIPVQCDVAEGARLLKMRLESESFPPALRKLTSETEHTTDKEEETDQASQRTHAEETKETTSSVSKAAGSPTRAEAWSSIDWWNATGGQVGQLAAALLVFLASLLNEYAQEVADAMNLYHLWCHSDVRILARKSNIGIRRADMLQHPLPLSDEDLKATLDAAVKASSAHCHWRAMADRALAGTIHKGAAPRSLVDAYLGMFNWPDPNTRANLRDSGPDLGTTRQDPGGIRRCLLDNLHACVRASPDCVQNIVQNIITPKFHQQPADANAVWARDLLTECAHALFVKSGLDPGVKVCDKLVCCFRIPHRDGKVFARPTIDPDVFAVASVEVQQKWLEVSPSEAYNDIKDHAHLVNQMARAPLMKAVAHWTPKDVEFLATVSFPL